MTPLSVLICLETGESHKKDRIKKMRRNFLMTALSGTRVN